LPTFAYVAGIVTEDPRTKAADVTLSPERLTATPLMLMFEPFSVALE
jgi:hypothetical protein